MLSHPFNRSTAIFRNALGYRPIARFFATRSPFLCRVCPLRVSHLKGSVQKRNRWDPLYVGVGGQAIFLVSRFTDHLRGLSLWWSELIWFLRFDERQIPQVRASETPPRLNYLGIAK